MPYRDDDPYVQRYERLGPHDLVLRNVTPLRVTGWVLMALGFLLVLFMVFQ